MAGELYPHNQSLFLLPEGDGQDEGERAVKPLGRIWTLPPKQTSTGRGVYAASAPKVHGYAFRPIPLVQ